MEMNWITCSLSIGEVADCSWRNRSSLQEEGVDIIMDIRHLFLQPYIEEGVDIDSLTDCTPIFPRVWRFVRLLHHLAEMNWRIMIHCHGGIDRAPFIATLFLWMNHGIPLEEAYAEVKNKRPQTIEHWEWIELARKSLE